jgi:uncharacterized protein YndB with AHSA1/START domain
MSTFEKTVTVDVPVRTAYDQWTQFESFPQFMEGVEEVRQLDDTHLHWKAEIMGVSREWDAEIVDQTPDERITWRATDGTINMGTVSFASEGAGSTRVTLRMDVEPEGFAEKAADALHLVQRRVEGDMDRFKEFIEARGTESGAWRGEVNPGDAASGTTGGTTGGTATGETGTTGTTGTPGTTGTTGGVTGGSTGGPGPGTFGTTGSL